MRQLVFTVPGEPRPKGRPRVGRTKAGAPVVFTDRKTASYENLVALAASQALQADGRGAFDGPLILRVEFFLPRPKSAPRRITVPCKKPDLDNLIKAVMDGMNQAGVWVDDSRVVCLMSRKDYGPDPRAVVDLREDCR